ncbi:hypothetical protein [Mariniblastus fucicola]|uniref:EamA-like transporter family protein n=1 Tax=Mariniblastus fucicola TaxID=980251 RepID=A0A5B9PG21_9BACT|nr:hypothetical protein [Mariniblastus fucicola]QEG24539.1 hypothetical protein MFFC18_44590 [Mariniblastus fucicola]
MKGFQFLIFVILTFCCWGLYGPLLHVGQGIMGGEGGKSMLRPFICVGVAYFAIAVLFPIFILVTKGEKGHWSANGFFWSFIAGLVGAVGALGIILAFKFNGKPSYVMPLVFGMAPIVNTFVTMLMARTFKQASAVFYLGILIVAVGAAGVLIFKPSKAKPAVDEPPAQVVVVDSLESQFVATTIDEDADTGNEETPAGSILWVTLSIALTAVCWGAYGPVLHKGQLKMGGSRLRPFLCVGLAYFAIAVVGPMLMLSGFPEPGGWYTTGIIWSLGAGAAGAIGALGIIYAFNFGGKPLFIMPLVFGFAPVVNTLTTIFTDNLFGRVNNMFFASLAMVIVGAVMVLVFSPRGKPPAKPVVKQPETDESESVAS